MAATIYYDEVKSIFIYCVGCRNIVAQVVVLLVDLER